MSLRKAINAMCRECAYDPKDMGSAAQQISCCITNTCPLHKVRPVTAKTIPERLLNAYSVSYEQLDSRAKALVTPSPLCSGESQFDHLLTAESISEAGSSQKY